MRNPALRSFNPLLAIAKRLILLVVGVVMLLNLTQPAALAAKDTNAEARLGAPKVSHEFDNDDAYRAAKEERRQWQSKASSVRDEEENVPETIGEKLNVDELAKGYDPEREAEKRAVPTP
ncbi:hypothetical protein ACQ4M4_23820 [Leptolyngbya sp. AN02str]|uniref:hypothetical protein n=1 Tax=Leptolyngbya sp. AN02str TaxID=3423363 RepID=UPI003D31CE2A